jgi:hypothetical protein
MLVDRDTSPQRNLYYVGARILQLFKEAPFKTIDIDVAFRELNLRSEREKSIPFNYFVLALDWLFLINAVDLTSDGDIVRCF